MSRKKPATQRYYYSDTMFSKQVHRRGTGSHPIISLIGGKEVVHNFTTIGQEHPHITYKDLKLVATALTNGDIIPIRLSHGEITEWAKKNGYDQNRINKILDAAYEKRKTMPVAITKAQYCGQQSRTAHAARQARTERVA